MPYMFIRGGNRLCGEAVIHGAKNSALPILAACAAVDGECVIENCPRLSDVDASVGILRSLGCNVVVSGSTALIDASCACGSEIPDRLMREMRSSITFLGALLSRYGSASLSLPGGCELGARPIDIHLAALSRMGVETEESHGRIVCRAPKGLQGAEIDLRFPSVGATENIMIAAAAARGTTVIRNAAREPEIADLGAFLNSCGARITGCGCSAIRIDGVERLRGCTHTTIPDRIEAVTYLAAAAVTGGEVILHAVEPEHMTQVLSVLEGMGCMFSRDGSSIAMAAPKRLHAAGRICTLPYPGFPTDAQALLMAMSSISDGTTVFVENMFDNRFKHAAQLCRMGAGITTEGRVAVVEGVERLSGCEVYASDLRSAAALVVAGLAADGETIVGGMHHLLRGYQELDAGLRALGGDINFRE